MGRDYMEGSPPTTWARFGGTMSALKPMDINGGFMAEIRVAPQRRNRAVVWIVVLAVIVAVGAWYFLAGPGAGA
jgi:hypothetical protein